MANQDSLEAGKAAAAATVKDFLASISLKRGPYPHARGLTLPSSYVVLDHPGELLQNNLDGVMTQVETIMNSIYDSGAAAVEEQLCAPGPEAWVQGDLAAVMAGYKVVVDGQAVSCGVNIFSLLRSAEASHGWKIAGIADTQWIAPEVPEAVKTEVAEDLMRPVDGMLENFRKGDWEAAETYLLPGGGVTLSIGLEVVQLDFPAWFARMKDERKAPPAQMEIEIKNLRVEARTVGDLGFVWLESDEGAGQVPMKGPAVFTLLRRDGIWLITGCQNASVPPQ